MEPNDSKNQTRQQQQTQAIKKTLEDKPKGGLSMKKFSATQGFLIIFVFYFEKIPIDKTFGVHIDSGKIFVTIISENNGTKTLLAQRQFAAKKDHHSEDPNNYAEACQEAIDLAEEDLSTYGDIYNEYINHLKEILLLLQRR